MKNWDILEDGLYTLLNDTTPDVSLDEIVADHLQRQGESASKVITIDTFELHDNLAATYIFNKRELFYTKQGFNLQIAF